MPAIAGLIVGTAAAWALGRYVRASAFGWDAPGGLAVGVVSVAILGIAIIAAIAPARRALRIDPVVVLRAE
jgi:ABC-type antimicrobial peptide transport system permease subunit